MHEEVAKKGIEIHLAPEVLFHIGSFPVTSTLLTAVVVAALLIFFAQRWGKNLTLKPSRLQVVIEALIMVPYSLVRTTLGNDSVARKVFPIIMTTFLFILCVNWFGLLPFVATVGLVHGDEVAPLFYPVATDLNFTLALALIAFFTIQISGIALLGVMNYGGKFITFSSPIAFAVGLIELISEFARIISFAFRLFGNIFAGKVLLVIAVFLVPYVIPVPLLAFEVFVGLIQAGIFAVLMLFFTKLAIAAPHESEHSSEEGAHHAKAVSA